MKEKFIEIFKANIKRNGADALLDYLVKSDFFTAPASTRFHLNREGGLCEHSINVFERLRQLFINESDNSIKSSTTIETIAICGLLHDLCKINYYKQEMRNVKENDEWVKKLYYTIDDKLGYGHGEGSVYITSNFIKLTRAEALAINWHMGGFDERVKSGSYAMNNAWNKHPLGMLLHCADLHASYLDENEISE